jgi:hypothetical protein
LRCQSKIGFVFKLKIDGNFSDFLNCEKSDDENRGKVSGFPAIFQKIDLHPIFKRPHKC